MKVIYIGEADVFASVLIKKLVDTNSETGIISQDDFEEKFFPKRDNIRMYTSRYYDTNVEGIFKNFEPDTVILAGSIILDKMSVCGEWGQYMKGVREIVRLCEKYKVKRLVYLSSVEVCRIDINYFNLKYEAHKEAERVVDKCAEESDVKVIKLRMGDVFSRERYCFKGGFMDRIIKDLESKETALANAGKRYFPVSVDDLSNILMDAAYGEYDVSLDKEGNLAVETVYNILPEKSVDEFNAYMMMADAIKSSHGVARQMYALHYIFDDDDRFNLKFTEKAPFISGGGNIKVVKKDYIKSGKISSLLCKITR